MRRAWRREDKRWDRSNYPHFTYFVVEGDAFEAARLTAMYAHLLYKEYEDDSAAEQLLRAQSGLIHCVFGDPFRPVTLGLTWTTPALVQLTQGIYDDRRFEDLPILADALEEAGCQEQSILDHLRSPGPHVRGCWPLDLILGRA